MGFHKAPGIEKVYLNFCKRNLEATKKKTTNNLVHCELGRLPRKKLRIFKYWLKIKNTNIIILKETCSNRCKTYKIIECRMLDIDKQTLRSSFSTSRKSMLYQHLVNIIFVCYFISENRLTILKKNYKYFLNFVTLFKYGFMLF